MKQLNPYIDRGPVPAALSGIGRLSPGQTVKPIYLEAAKEKIAKGKEFLQRFGGIQTGNTIRLKVVVPALGVLSLVYTQDGHEETLEFGPIGKAYSRVWKGVGRAANQFKAPEADDAWKAFTAAVKELVKA